MSDWRHQGKQVLQDGQHFADAAGELEAMMIVNAMRALDAPTQRTEPWYYRDENGVEREGVFVHHFDPPRVEKVPEPITDRGAAFCRPRREGDEYACSKGCGVRWSINEPAPRCGRAT